MAERIRTFDWGTTPLGSIDQWPGTLRTCVELLVTTLQPMYIAWGPKLSVLYGDAMIPTMGDRHPDALGRPWADVWAQVADEYRPTLEAILRGEPQFVVDAPVAISLHPGDPVSYFTFSSTPVRDDSGRIAGILTVATDTTEKVQFAEEMRETQTLKSFLITLSDALRSLSDPGEIMATAAEMFGRHLDVAIVQYLLVESDGDIYRVAASYGDGRLPLIRIDSGGISDHGPGWGQLFRAGEAIWSDDHESRPGDAGASRRFGVRSGSAVPLIRDGGLVAIFSTGHPDPRTWTDAERTLQREVAERTWAAVERARAEAALRINNQRMRAQKEAFQAAVNDAPLGESLGILARIVAEETAGEARTAFYVSDADGACLHPVWGAGDMPASYLEQIDGFGIGTDSFSCGLATATGRPVLTRDVFDEPRWKPWIHLAEECGFRGCWSFPIETRDSNPVGTFAMYFATPRDASPHDLARADAITQAAAIIIARHTEAKERARVEVALRESETSLQQRVSAATAELRALSRRLLAVHEEERRYLARELHDEIGQMLTALQIQLATLDRESRANGKEALDKALETVRELTTRVSEISMDLRPSTLDTLGLIPALLSYLERYQGRTGVSIEMRHHGLDRRFATPIETTAYRVVQEALTNVARHSNAISASVQFLADIETMTIVIRDNGRGFDLNATADAGGLSGMRERVELLDGTWSIETEVGAGTLITAELPLSGSDSEGSIH